MRYILYGWDLQLFGEGGDGAGAAPGDAPAAEGQTGVIAPDAGEAPVNNTRRANKRQPLNVDYGRAPEQEAPAQQKAAEQKQDEAAAPEETFEDLIKGRYKEDYDKRVQDTISKRFKSADRDKKTLESLSPLLQKLGSKYEMDLSEITDESLKKLLDAVDEDDSYLEDEAYRRGMTVRSLKELKKLESENAARKRADEQRQHEAQQRETFDKLYKQSEAAKQFYPGFDLQTEMNNPAFIRLTQVGVDAKTAYEVIHKDEILRGGMAYAAQKAAQRVSDSVQANASRPAENGVAAPSAPARTRVTDPKLLTKEQRRDLRERVRRGEKVYW